jgi:hypothetical protein
MGVPDGTTICSGGNSGADIAADIADVFVVDV